MRLTRLRPAWVNLLGETDLRNRLSILRAALPHPMILTLDTTLELS